MPVAHVKIYTTGTCPYCVSAKTLLQSKKITPTEVRIDKNAKDREEMIELTGKRSVPQIFINNELIGGLDDLERLNDTGELDELLRG